MVKLEKMKKLICEYIMACVSKPARLVRSHHKKYRPLSKNNISPNSVLKNSKYNYINKMYRKYYFINIEIVNFRFQPMMSGAILSAASSPPKNF